MAGQARTATSAALPDPAEVLAADNAPIAVWVLTGFLGSGKTTLLRHILGCPDMAETAVVINEIGEIALDHHLVEAVTDEIMVLQSGCLCCSLRNDLVDTLRDLLCRLERGEVPPFRRVLIETSGLADPSPILQSLMSDPLRLSRLRLQGLCTTVDAASGEAVLGTFELADKQAALADHLLLTKTDLIETSAIELWQDRLHALNPSAPVTTVRHGRIDPGRLFQADLAPSQARILETRAASADRQFSTSAHQTAEFVALTVVIDQPLQWDRLVGWLERLIADHGVDILRVKGIVRLADSSRPVAIHGVQHIFHPPRELAAWPDQDRRSRMVFIARRSFHARLAEMLAQFRRQVDGAETATPAAARADR